MALGGALLALGALALLNLTTATQVTVYMVGILMLVGGIAQIALAFDVRQWECRRSRTWI